jgi:SpoVK/Ycf46/Vps4 family AAA+-type ATPase
LIESLKAAVEATPTDNPLRLHLAEQLAQRGDYASAIRHAAIVLQSDPTDHRALAIVRTDSTRSAPTTDSTDPIAHMEEQLADVLPPRFVEPTDPATEAFEVEDSGVRLRDVGGMTEVKDRLEASFLAPLRNPELVRLYGKSLRGGLLLYGPPGCGKTFIARAVAGEMGARFLAVSLAEILDAFIGASERNLRELFEIARRNAPCVLFLDEIDALGQKRSQMHGSLRGTTTQLLAEMDGIGSKNEGVYVLGATNHPWDVDVALRRPGRFDRMILVLPPDAEAREAIFRYHLSERPVEGIDVRGLATRTDGYSGADVAHICESAAEKALIDSARSGTPRMIGMDDLEAALQEVRPSIGPWFDVARNVAQFSNSDGTYDDLLAYLRRRRLV